MELNLREKHMKPREFIVHLRTNRIPQSRRKVAQATGISPANLKLIEDGSHDTTVPVAKKLAAYYGLHPMRFLDLKLETTRG